VLGSVVTPQTFRWKGKVTLSKAIADAGGFRPDADRGKVTLLRNMLADPAQAVPLTLNFDLIARGQQPDPELDPGTVITVPQRQRPNNHLLDLGIMLLRLLVF
jgi:protein involved in polysaccharide export with SLBB domain